MAKKTKQPAAAPERLTDLEFVELKNARLGLAQAQAVANSATVVLDYVNHKIIEAHKLDLAAGDQVEDDGRVTRAPKPAKPAA